MPVARLPLGELAAFGAFFAVDIHDSPPGPPWLALGQLVGESEVLRTRVHSVRSALARNGGRLVEDVELRVAASTAHLGLVARLIAPAVAVAALGSPQLDLRIEQLWWQDTLTGPIHLSVTADAVDRPLQLGGTAIDEITRAVARGFAVSEKVLWGNVASAANSAASLVAGSRSDLAEQARRAADLLLADDRLDGGRLRSGAGFRRRSCCLIYRLADRSAVCGDCVLGAA